MRFEWAGALRRSLAGFFALASISAAFPGECIPDLSRFTATPTMTWGQSDTTTTAGYHLYWKRAEDFNWRGVIDLRVWPGDDRSSPVYPGITESYPIQRLIPTSEQRVLVDLRVAAYDASGREGKPSSILRVCMPEIWTGGPYR